VAANWALRAVALSRGDLCGWGESNGCCLESGDGHHPEAGGAIQCKGAVHC